MRDAPPGLAGRAQDGQFRSDTTCEFSPPSPRPQARSVIPSLPRSERGRSDLSETAGLGRSSTGCHSPGPVNHAHPTLRLGGSPPPPRRDPLLRRRGEAFTAWAERLAAAGLNLPRSPDGWPLPLRVGARADVLERFGGALPPERLSRLLGACAGHSPTCAGSRGQRRRGTISMACRASRSARSTATTPAARSRGG